MKSKVSEYLDSLVPKNLSKKRRAQLFLELEDHIVEKAGHYMEIGYPQEESFDLALRDMGEDAETVKAVRGEFESLYREKTWQAVLAAAAVLLLNLFCVLTGRFVASVEYLGDPDFAMNCISFTVMFVLLFIIVYAKALGFRKTLFAVGVSCFAIAASVLYCVFPQAALFSVETNVLFLIDRFTPLSVWSSSHTGAKLFSFLSYAFVAVCAVCCFVFSWRIKAGRAKQSDSPKRTILAFCAVFLSVAGLTCGVYPGAYAHVKSIPQYITPDNSYISSETDRIYSLLEKTGDYEESRKILTRHGLVNAEEFKKTLTYSQQKALSKQLKQLKLADESFEAWLPKEKKENGNGLIFLKNDGSGRVAARGTGNGSKFLEKGEYNAYNVYVYDTENCDAEKSEKYFRALKKGTDEKEALKFFEQNHGCVYSKFTFFENGATTDRYRIYQRWEGKDEKLGANVIYNSQELFTELVFTGKKLSSGSMMSTLSLLSLSDGTVETSNLFSVEN